MLQLLFNNGTVYNLGVIMALSRRSFLQSSVAGVAATTLVSLPVGKSYAETGASSWTNGNQVNPEIDNTRVVSFFDETMITTATADTFATRTTGVDSDKIERNIDAMALQLAKKSSPHAAWAVIFQKPAAKEWNQTKVAIKVNCIYSNMMPNVAIVGKVCKVLIERGVPAGNITIYDSCHNASGNEKYTGQVGKGIPEGVIVSTLTGDGEQIAVGSGTLQCTSVVTGCDILVNCAINKGHSQTDKGGFTLTMKNHTGTMKYSCPTLQEMINENRCDTILGGTPPRQQLCIVDCLWSAKEGPFENASHLTHRIVMGTFGPVVDIAVAKKIREPIMSATHNAAAMSTILSSFGYTEADIQWEEHTPAGAAVQHGQLAARASKELTLAINRGGTNITIGNFPIEPQSALVTCSISDLTGKNLRTLRVNALTSTTVVWDGFNRSGHRVKSGTYVAAISAAGKTTRHTFSLVR